MKYEIRQIDAWFDGEAWTYNESFRIGEFSTKGDLLEIQNRKSGEPLFVAIPMD